MIISATLLASQSARADCTPQAAGQSSLVATCTGTTTNQGGGAPGTSAGANGYGTAAENAIVTVESGATVSGTAPNARGIYLGQGTVINRAGGTITGDQAAIATGGTNDLNIQNSGIIQGNGFGIDGLGQTTVTNNAGGAITGTAYGVSGTTLILENYGTITGTNYGGAAGFLASTITNYAGGTITGSSYGVTVNQAGNIGNYGTITGVGPFVQAAIGVGANSLINNFAGGIISSSAQAAIRVGADSAIYNSGTISGFVYGIHSNPGAGGVSVYNAGSISATLIDGNTGAIDAILFEGTGNKLTIAPGSSISGAAIGTGNDTFELGGGGAATFDVSQLSPTGQYRGFGTFKKANQSVWTLTGTSTFAGPVQIDGGTLLVSGDISSASGVTVNSSGVLGGTGTVGNVAVNGGTLAPGQSIGTLNVTGSLSFTAASTYLIELSPTSADRTNVAGVATLAGATVQAVFAPGSYVSRQYTILSAAGGLNGSFGALNTNLSPNFSTSLSYDANNKDVYLDLVLHFAIPGGLNANQQNVGNALTNAFNSNGGISSIYAALSAAGLTQAAGETATGSQQATFNAMSQFMGVLTDPFIAGRGETATPSGTSSFAADDTRRGTSRPERDAYALMFAKAPIAQTHDPRWSVWAAGFGGSQTTDGNTSLGSNNTTSSLAGVAVGADYRLSPDTVAGFALAGGGTSFSVDNSGHGRSDLFQAGAFVHHKSGPAYVSAALAYGFQDITTDRIVTIAGADRLHAAFNANAYSGRIEGGYRFATPWLGGLGLTPYAAGQFTTFDLPAYAESALVGTPAFALAYGAKSVTDGRSELGVRSDKSFALANAMLTLRGRLAWAHDFNADRSAAATFQALPGASFVVNGAAQPHDSALTTASAEMRWTNGWSAAATFEGEFADTVRSYTGKGVVRYAW
ncbi:autotransporter outer membrane beta-barrel domain-containing protein [Bradyrhizobium sp. 1]|uniref:autotransporter outer membrane beta-barrel domain-containing protein n=1 Tax=Bradyrhizobium sp. 1 TaxID=241591 RepID=UPI001FFBE96F|nr:autotransporter outer membrane beta-barrel domain-containing protein [Bradyrhizobium sp. 1]